MYDSREGERSGPTLASDRFVGRDAQLDLLAGRLAHEGPRARALLVHGDPGIGKTRFLVELAARMADRGWRVVWGRSWVDEGTPPYWLWTQVARELRGLVQGTDLAQIVLDEPDDPQRLALFDATSALLRRAAEQSPVLVLLDDLHAADIPSLVLARFVVEQLVGTPVGVIGAYRPREAAARPEVRAHLDLLSQPGADLRLGGLEVEDLAQLIGDDLRARDVHEVTGGNPLFVEQVVRSADGATRPSITPSGTRTTLALLAAITARLDALAPGPRGTLVGAAVLGGATDASVLARLVDRDVAEIETDLGALVAAGLADPTAVDPQPTLHSLVAEAALASITEEMAAALHHRAATQLIGTPEDRPGELAYHLLRAGPEHRHEAVHACRRAAAAAMAATAYEDAAAHYERALHALDAGSPDHEADADRQRLSLLLELGYALRVADRVAAADEAFDRAVELADVLDDPDSRALATLRGGIQYFFAADRDVPLEERCRAALAGLAPGDSPMRARLLAELATRADPTPDAGRTMADEAVAMARRTNDPVALGCALAAQQVTALGPETLARRLATAHEILALARAVGDPPLDVQGRYLLFGALVERGDLRGFGDELASDGEGFDDLADRHRARLARWLAGVRATFAGEVERAEAIAERGLAVALEHQDAAAWRIYGAQIGVIRWLQDRTLEMEPLFDAQGRARPHEPMWPAAVAYVRATHGRFDEARAALSGIGPDQVPPGMHWLVTMTLLAETAVALHDDSGAAALRDELLPYADRFVPLNLGAAAWGTVARPLGLIARHLGDLDEAISHLDRAVEVCARMGARPWLVQAQLDLADTLVLADRADDARVGQLVDDASSAAEDLGIRRFADRSIELRARVKVSRLRPHDRPHRRPSVSVLGAFEVISADGVVASWTSRKARELLKVLVAHRGASVHREVLMDLLWPGIEVAVLGNRLSVALSTVRRALDPDRSAPADEFIAADRSSVRLRTDRVDVDAERFLTTSEAALDVHRAGGDGSLDRLVGAIKLHRGPALPDEPYAEWASSLQSEVWTMHLRLARTLADCATAAGQDLVAIDALRRIREADPLDEASVRQLVTVLERVGLSIGRANTSGPA